MKSIMAYNYNFLQILYKTHFHWKYQHAKIIEYVCFQVQ